MNHSKLIPVELRPNRQLIDSNFDSYKLSLSPLPSYKAAVTDGVYTVVAKDGDVGYEKIRCLTLHNYLVLDWWNKDDVYYIDTHGCIRKYHVSLESHIEPPKVVFSLGSELSSKDKPLPPSFVFPSATFCIVCDGIGGMFLLDTGLRSDGGPNLWKILCYDEDKRHPSIILHAVYRSSEKDKDIATDYVDCLLLKFNEQNTVDNHGSAPTVVLEWTSFEKVPESDEFRIGDIKTFTGKTVPMYAAISSTCSDLYVAASSSFQYKPAWSTEADEEIESIPDLDEENENATQPSPYRWRQNSENITIYIDLPPEATSSFVAYSLSSKHLNIAIRKTKDSEPVPVLKGDLYLDADPESSLWTIADGQLEVTLQKRVEGRTWVTVVEGDDRGEFLVDPEEAEKIHRQLSHLTSETLNTDPPEGKLFNSDQLEDCDAYYDSSASLMRFDSTSDKFTHVADISSLRWLFNYSTGTEDVPAFVLRHDVDAVAWQPLPPTVSIKKDSKILYKHVATFNALGYVHASKTNLKFCSSPPDASYAAFCECQRRVYLYRQPTPLTSSLRNRTSGTVIGKVAFQQVATIESNIDILGFVTTNERIYVLTMEELIVFKVMSDVGA